MKGPAVKDPAHLAAPPFLQSGPGRFVSLRTKFVVFFSLIIILTCSGMSWYFIHSKRVAMTERVQDLEASWSEISPTTSVTASSSRTG